MRTTRSGSAAGSPKRCAGAQADYWRRTLAGAPAVLNLPLDRPRPSKQDYAGAALRLEFDERLTAALRALSLRRGTTLFMTLLAGWAALLARLSGQEDVVIGAAVANRGRVEIEPPDRLLRQHPGAPDRSRRGSFGRRASRPGQGAGSRRAAASGPAVRACGGDRAAAAEPCVRADLPDGVRLAEPRRGAPRTDRSDSDPAGSAAVARQMRSDAEPRRGRRPHRRRPRIFNAPCSTAKQSSVTADIFAGCSRRWRRTRRRRSIGCLCSARRSDIGCWSNGTRPKPTIPQHTGVHELVEAQAARTPQACAVVHDDGRLTYAELDASANRLARRLRALGVRPDDRVAIALERSIGLVVAQLAILKCGAAYVPLDQTAPPQRQAFMINDCGARVVLTGGGAIAPEIDGVTPIDIDHDTQGGPDGRDWESSVAGEATAYVIYTSGSSGEPKGVLTPHRAIVRLAVNNGYADFQSSDRVAFASNPAFDASTMEVWATLLNGGAVVIVDQATLLDPQQFGRVARAARDHRALADRGSLPPIRRCPGRTVRAPAHSDHRRRCGGSAGCRARPREEPAAAPAQRLWPHRNDDFRRHLPNSRVAPSATSIPIGRPIANTRIYISTNIANRSPLAQPGEILYRRTGRAQAAISTGPI